MESQTSDETDFEAELEKFYKKTDKLESKKKVEEKVTKKTFLPSYIPTIKKKRKRFLKMDGFIRKKSKMCYFDQNAHFMDEIKKNKSPEKCNMRFFSGVRKEVKSPGHCWKGLTKWQVGKFGFKWRCVWCGQKCEYEDDYRNKKGILKIIDKNGGIGKNFAPISTVYLSKKLSWKLSQNAKNSPIEIQKPSDEASFYFASVYRPFDLNSDTLTSSVVDLNELETEKKKEIFSQFFPNQKSDAFLLKNESQFVFGVKKMHLAKN